MVSRRTAGQEIDLLWLVLPISLNDFPLSTGWSMVSATFQKVLDLPSNLMMIRQAPMPSCNVAVPPASPPPPPTRAIAVLQQG